MQWLANPSNLPVISVIGISLTTLLFGVSVGIFIGKGIQSKYEDWFYRKGRRPWWV